METTLRLISRALGAATVTVRLVPNLNLLADASNKIENETERSAENNCADDD